MKDWLDGLAAVMGCAMSVFGVIVVTMMTIKAVMIAFGWIF